MACLKSPAGPPPNDQWVAFVDHEVAVEEARKSSIEARGVAAVTASGAVATILLALITVTKKSGQSVLVVPGSARPWVVTALTFFLVSAVLGLLTNVPVNLHWVKRKEISAYIYAHWSASLGATQQEVMDHQIKRLSKLNKWNTLKGYVLMGAMFSQVVAIAFIAIAVFAAF
jgi:hypothetical protein